MDRRSVCKKEYEILVDQNVGICRSCQSLIWHGSRQESEGPEDCDQCHEKRAVISIEKANMEGLIVVMNDNRARIFV